VISKLFFFTVKNVFLTIMIEYPVQGQKFDLGFLLFKKYGGYKRRKNGPDASNKARPNNSAPCVGGTCG
jgi:hypothetical protein